VPVRVRLIVVLAIVLTAGACGSDDPTPAASPTPSATEPDVAASPTHGQQAPVEPPSPAPERPSSPQGDAYLSLCEVRSDLAAGDAASAEATFEDEVHETLHEIAHELETADRQAAAALLVAKSEVEAGFAEASPDAKTLEWAVAALLVATSDGMAVLGLDVPECPAP